jgi:PTS system ascorbate-specific IIA component
MTIGLLLITHDRIGDVLLDSARNMLGFCPLATKALAVLPNSDPDTLLKQARQNVKELDQGQGVLVLTDIYGSTPSNIAKRLAEGSHVRVVAGLNLPMLVRVLNYPRLSLPELADKALSGGRDGIVACHVAVEILKSGAS